MRALRKQGDLISGAGLEDLTDSHMLWPVPFCTGPQVTYLSCFLSPQPRVPVACRAVTTQWRIQMQSFYSKLHFTPPHQRGALLIMTAWPEFITLETLSIIKTCSVQFETFLQHIHALCAQLSGDPDCGEQFRPCPGFLPPLDSAGCRRRVRPGSVFRSLVLLVLAAFLALTDGPAYRQPNAASLVKPHKEVPGERGRGFHMAHVLGTLWG